MKRLVVLFAAAATLSLAQGPMMPGRGPGPGSAANAGVDDVKAFLKLTDAQLATLRGLRRDEAESNRAVHEKIGERAQALRTAMQRVAPVASEVGQILIDMQNLRKQVADNDAKYRTQALAVLTAEQKVELAKLDAARQLQDEVHQATALNLLERPGPPAGAGPIMRRMPGPAGFGPHMLPPPEF